MIKKNVFLLFFCFLSLSLWGRSEPPWLDIEIWCELEPLIVEPGQDFPIPRKEALDRLLEEGRIIFSYMIYGAAFSYTPSDASRKVEEIFTLTPLYEIPWGDKNLSVLSSRVEEEKLFAKLRYHLEEFQRLRIQGWMSNNINNARGRGGSDYFKGYTNKIKAVDSAVKEGLRDYMRREIYNKPRLIKGEFLLTEEPYTIIREGEYISNVAFRFIVRELIPYRVF